MGKWAVGRVALGPTQCASMPLSRQHSLRLWTVSRTCVRAPSARLGHTGLAQKAACPSTWPGPGGAGGPVEDGGTHARTQTLCPPHPDPDTGSPKPRATDHTSLYSVQSRAGGQGPSFSGCVRRCSIGGTQTGPQSANKLGGKFSGCCRAGARVGCQVAPRSHFQLPSSALPGRQALGQHAS